MTSRPLVAVLTVATGTDGLAATFDALVAQTESRWQWCIAVAGGASAGTLSQVRSMIAAEPRAVAAGRTAGPPGPAALALSLADAESVCWVDAGDTLDPATFATVRDRYRSTSWMYTDEAARSDDGLPTDIWYKPDFAPERLRSQPYALRLAVLPLAQVHRLGGLPATAGSAAWYELVLRAADSLATPAHLAGPFYLHGDRGTGAPYVSGQARDRCLAVSRVLSTRAEPSTGAVVVTPVEARGRPIGQRVQRRLPRIPRISVVIPTAGTSSIIHGFPRCHVVEFVRSVWTSTRYPNLEIVIVHDLHTPQDVLLEIKDITGGEAVLLPFAGPFHFSRKCNAGAVASTGEYLAFCNDDMSVITQDWLHEMASLLTDPGVGAVGARLLFADGTLQHAGHEYNGGHAGHTMFRYAADDPDEGGAALVTSERSGVTGACMLLRATDFLLVGGFSDEFPSSYNDVDLSLKIRSRGLRILYTPHATLYHFESQSREPTVTDEEMSRIRLRWAEQLQADPYVNELLRRPLPAPPSIQVQSRRTPSSTITRGAQCSSDFDSSMVQDALRTSPSRNIPFTSGSGAP